jgi:hypothetical protein
VEPAWSEGLDLKLTKAWEFYGVIIVVTLIGLLLNFLKINPIKALVYSVVINGVGSAPDLHHCPDCQEQEHHGAV